MKLSTIICILLVLMAGIQAVAAAETYVYAAQWGKAGGSPGTGSGEFNQPARIAFDTHGSVFVDDMNNHRIQKFNTVGGFVTTWGSEGVADPPSAAGTFLYPLGVAVDSQDYLYVADRGIHRVQVMDPSQVWTVFGPNGTVELLQPSDVAVDSSDNVYVVDWGHNRIRMFDLQGTPLGEWGSLGSGNLQFNGPRGIAVDSVGNVYVADTGNNRVQKFDSTGAYLATIGTSGTGNGQLSGPWGVDVDTAGNVYVADTGNNRVEKFDSTGAYLATIGTAGTGNGQFSRPFDVSVNSVGMVYVADTGNNRVQFFLPKTVDTTPLLVPGGVGVPTDTNGDGRYDDVNGNRALDFNDVVLYFNQMDWIAANEPLAAFDYNGNGQIDFNDVVWLFNQI
jgi:streptogramin lyase